MIKFFVLYLNGKIPKPWGKYLREKIQESMISKMQLQFTDIGLR